MKQALAILTILTAGALHILGADSRFETYLEYDGVIDSDKILRRNLYIHGGGDPCLGSDRISGVLSWNRQIKAWADAVEKLGIQRIEGKVIGDAEKWEKALAVPSWSWEDLGNSRSSCYVNLSSHISFLFLKFTNKATCTSVTAR